MLPDSMRGYAPTVRGVAETNAKVTVRQNGVVLYETTVAPGPFTISDLYATGYGGDLAVTVTEADGRVRSFAVPYASVPQLLRPG
ncbi:fimbria/pilus outer membrane usher protein, partial [Salmonella enterica]